MEGAGPGGSGPSAHTTRCSCPRPAARMGRATCSPLHAQDSSLCSRSQKGTHLPSLHLPRSKHTVSSAASPGGGHSLLLPAAHKGHTGRPESRGPVPRGGPCPGSRGAPRPGHAGHQAAHSSQRPPGSRGLASVTTYTCQAFCFYLYIVKHNIHTKECIYKRDLYY